MNKKAIELAVSTLVILIISIIIFGSSMYLLQKVYTGSKKIEASVDASTKREIETLLKETNDIIGIPRTTKDTSKGKPVQFELGIRNVLDDDADFGVRIEFDNGYFLNGIEIPNVDPEFITREWLGSWRVTDNIHVKVNDFEAVPLVVIPKTGIAQGESIPAGEYAFNVCVYRMGNEVPEGSCRPSELSTGAITDQLYPKGRMLQVTVRVR